MADGLGNTKCVSVTLWSVWLWAESRWDELFNISYQGIDPLSCNWGLGDLQMCRISHRPCTHTKTHACTHRHCINILIMCCGALCPSDCPATAAASAAATQNQPPAAANPGEASLRVCVRVGPSTCMYPSNCTCICVCMNVTWCVSTRATILWLWLLQLFFAQPSAFGAWISVAL